MTDPRICRTPFPFASHRTMAQVASDERGCNNLFKRKLATLSDRIPASESVAVPAIGVAHSAPTRTPQAARKGGNNGGRPFMKGQR